MPVWGTCILIFFEPHRGQEVILAINSPPPIGIQYNLLHNKSFECNIHDINKLQFKRRNIGIEKNPKFKNSLNLLWNLKTKCRGPDLNQRHPDLQSGVLPTELPRQMGRTRFELVITSVSGRYHTPRPPAQNESILNITLFLYNLFHCRVRNQYKNILFG